MKQERERVLRLPAGPTAVRNPGEVRVFVRVLRMATEHASDAMLDFQGIPIPHEESYRALLVLAESACPDGHVRVWQETSGGRALQLDNLLRHGFQSLADLTEILDITGWRLNITERNTPSRVVFTKIDARRKFIREKYPNGVALFDVFKDWWDEKIERADFFHVSRTGFEVEYGEDEVVKDGEDKVVTFEGRPLMLPRVITGPDEVELRAEDYKTSFGAWHVSASGFFERQHGTAPQFRV